MSYTTKQFSDAVWGANGKSLKSGAGSFPNTRLGLYTESIWTYASRKLHMIGLQPILKTVPISVADTNPVSERLRFKQDETIFSIELSNPPTSAYTLWRFTNRTNPLETFTIQTSSNGLTNAYGNVSYGSLDELHISLDRTKKWYLQIRTDDSYWSDAVLLEMQPRIVAAFRDAKVVVTETSTGATVRATYPSWTEQKTASGVTITNLVYSDDSIESPTIVNTSHGAIVYNNG